MMKRSVSEEDQCINAGGDFGGSGGPGDGNAGGFGGSAPVSEGTVGGGEYGGSKQGDMASQVGCQLDAWPGCCSRCSTVRQHV